MPGIIFSEDSNDARNWFPETECHRCEGIIGQLIKFGGCIHQKLKGEKDRLSWAAFDRGYDLGCALFGIKPDREVIFAKIPKKPRTRLEKDLVAGFDAAREHFGEFTLRKKPLFPRGMNAAEIRAHYADKAA